jgi:hypothetical protein
MRKIGLYLFCAFNLTFTLNLMAGDQRAPEQQQRVEFLGMISSLPAAWTEEAPSSSMRLAQFRVPGTDTSGNANLVLYFFGQGQGGSVQANIARWQSQFSSPGGGPVEPRTTTMEVNDMPVTLVELRGNYARGVGMGPVGAAAADQILLASIVESPRGNIYIQLHGPADIVSSQREAYLSFIEDIRPGSAASGAGE